MQIDTYIRNVLTRIQYKIKYHELLDTYEVLIYIALYIGISRYILKRMSIISSS